MTLPEADRDLAYGVHRHEHDGIVTIEFFYGGGFPVKHSVYLHRSAGAVERNEPLEMRCRWAHVKRLNERWYYVGD